MAEVTKMDWNEVAEMADVDEEISAQDQKDSEDIGFKSFPVGMFLVEVLESCGIEAALSNYTCIAANLKLGIQAIIEVEQDILQHNDMMAARNRGYFDAKNIFTINLVSSPGSGKTSILERTLSDLKNEISFSVIEGDQQTLNDANRIDALNIPVLIFETAVDTVIPAFTRASIPPLTTFTLLWP